LIKDERGFSLIEVLIALAIMGLVAVAFLSGLATASRALIIADERTTAESLARSQIEYVKEQEYDYASLGHEPSYDKIEAIPDNYSIWSVNYNGDTVNGGNDDDIITIPWDADLGEPAAVDDGLQKIKLVIKHGGKEVFTFTDADGNKITLEDYKVDR
jgi:prepilin-type N-terminal cleavage/methylation domain-containing protein